MSRLIHSLFYSLVLTTLFACGGSGGDSDQGDGDNSGNSGVTPVLANNLVLSANNLPDECEFDGQVLRNFAQCDLSFQMQLTQGQVSDASFVGQVSTDSGNSWQNLTTNNLSFVLPVNQFSGAVLIRGLMQYQQNTSLTDNLSFTLQQNTISLLDAGDFANDRIYYVDPADFATTQLSFKLPTCVDAEQDSSKVVLRKNNQYLVEQQSGATIQLARNKFANNDVINAVCIDSFNAQSLAPGSIQIKLEADPEINIAPELSFAPLPASISRYQNLIRDGQAIEICLNASDQNNDALTLNLAAQTGAGLQNLALIDNCHTLNTDNFAGQALSLIATASDGTDNTQVNLDLGTIYPDSLPVGQTVNSSCQLGSSDKTVAVTVTPDTEFDTYSVSVIQLADNAANNTVLRELGQVTSANLTFSCQQLGTTRYQLLTQSRGKSISSQTYTHSVTSQVNQLPELNFTIQGDVLTQNQNIVYRDNQTLDVCIETSDADGDSLSSEVLFQWENLTAQALNLTNNCGQISTEGRGGQQIKLIATVNDGQTSIEKQQSLGRIHTDTIQFARTQSQACIAGEQDLTYTVNVNPDAEGDSHQLTVINADTQAVIKTLGTVTSGQFTLSCQQAQSLAFQIKNESRELVALSPVYLHTVSEKANEQPSLTYTLEVLASTAEESSGVDKIDGAFRDNDNLKLCIESQDPEGEAVNITGTIKFDHLTNTNLSTEIAVALDAENCMQFSTYYKGNQNLTIILEASDGVTKKDLAENKGIIHQDQINTPSSQSGSCTLGSSNLSYPINIEPDPQGDNQALTVFEYPSNTEIASAIQTDGTGGFSLSCQALANSQSFYIQNKSRGLTSTSLIYQHQVLAPINTVPELSYAFANESYINDKLRDNQTFEICLTATDADNDNLTLSAQYQVDGQAEQNISLNNFCGQISTFGAGNKNLNLTLSAHDGQDTTTITQPFEIHQDTVQFAYTGSQSCQIGDTARNYQITLNDDTEGDAQTLAVYRSDNVLLQDLGTNRSFVLGCNTAGTTDFYIETRSRGLSTRSVVYQHLVSNTVNTRPTINLTLNTADIEYVGSAIRDRQNIEVCAQVNDAETPADQLNVQLYYRFDNQTLQSVALTNQCGTIDLTNRGGQSLVIQGFASDGTATGNQERNLGTIHKDTIQTAISNSGSCRVGEQSSHFIARIAADIEGDSYALDVIDANSGEILVELGQITAGNFTLPCDEIDAIDFIIRTTSRGLTQNSIVYSHVIDNTLNAKPQLDIELVDAELVSGQVRDGQTLQVCLSATDSDNDEISYRAIYQFTNEPTRTLSLNTQQCGFISTSNRGGAGLLIQGFADDGVAQTTQLYEISQIHTDTLAIPSTVSSSCTIGEEAIVYAIDIADDAENDLRTLTVNLLSSGEQIALFDENNDLSEFEFSLPCETVGQTLFTITASSRELTQTSDTFSHTVNASLTNQIQVWLTTADQTQLLAEQDEITLRASAGTATHQIDVSDSSSYQEIKGFGAGLTDSSASLIFESEDKAEIISQLFEPNQGAGLSRVRISLSGLGEYVARAAQSYNDRPAGLTDPELEFFSTAADDEYFLPVLSDILAQNTEIKVDAASWSAPGWMKDNDALNGGSLRLEFYDEYASYLAKALTEYQNAGIEIASFSLQNQPHLEANYPSMSFANTDYQSFFQNNLYPQFTASQLSPSLWIWDGNWTDYDTQQDADIALFTQQALANDFIYGRAFGVALQCYQANNGAADVSRAISLISNLTRARDVFITSCRNQNNGRTFGQYLVDTSSAMIMPYLNAGASSVLLDNLILDSNFGPVQGGCTNCRALLTKESNGDITKNAEFYAFAHFSRFIQSQAYRIDASQINDVLATQAFKNPDNSIVLVVTNQTNILQEADINWQGQSALIQIPAQSMMTLIWNSENSGVADLQQIQQASLIAQNALTLVETMRDPSGLYASKLNLQPTSRGELSVAATGLALVGLSIADKMQWNTSALSLANATLDALLGDNEDFEPARDEFGIFAKQLSVDGSALSDNYSLLETAYLLAGAQFAKHAFDNTQLSDKVDTLFASVDWQGVTANAEQGIAVIERNLALTTLNTQGVYNQQMLLIWLAKEAGNLPAKNIWDRYYASGELANLNYYNDYPIPADENGESISATIHQLNYYLINPVLASANYRQLFASQANAEKTYWLENQNQASYIWGFGYGTDNTNLPTAEFNSLTLHTNTVAHAPSIAGFVAANNEYLDDLLAWQNNADGILETNINSISIPWRYQTDDLAWQSQQIDMLSLAPLFIGLASHPGLLDIQFFRANNQSVYQN
ncbi:hypothetical protein N7931_01685 [Catenovulum sp. 2E275]|uniref:glycoside hydrolase family 30 protein n=1 Tax=Catenovulum sp. 2E275 TaxID=2980497 RepID=UPI0021D0312C|nr:glycoside hydrolase family 30 beta sandwich domain-containing protein [Catenovulum sp. 2E275]MCU4674330.1 hypothetical protein [Catenovulum sp. 2E275]